MVILRSSTMIVVIENLFFNLFVFYWEFFSHFEPNHSPILIAFSTFLSWFSMTSQLHYLPSTILFLVFVPFLLISSACVSIFPYLLSPPSLLLPPFFSPSPSSFLFDFLYSSSLLPPPSSLFLPPSSLPPSSYLPLPTSLFLPPSSLR